LALTSKIYKVLFLQVRADNTANDVNSMFGALPTTTYCIGEDNVIAASDQQESISIVTTSTNADDISILEEDITVVCWRACLVSVDVLHRRMRLKTDFPRSYRRDWATGKSSRTRW
jgi:hypothetical protein